jgi:regulator of ribonuclease activity A
MIMATADLCDDFGEELTVLAPIFSDYGGQSVFEGEIATLKVFEDNTLVRAELERSGEKKVLVIDGGGSLRCALVGDNLAVLAKENGWSGIIVFGCKGYRGQSKEEC